jgi:hypothetical protein
MTRRVPVAVNGPQDLQKRRQKQIEMAAMQQHISKVSPPPHYDTVGFVLISRKSALLYATRAKKHGRQTPEPETSKPAKQTFTTDSPASSFRSIKPSHQKVPPTHPLPPILSRNSNILNQSWKEVV